MHSPDGGFIQYATAIDNFDPVTTPQLISHLEGVAKQIARRGETKYEELTQVFHKAAAEEEEYAAKCQAQQRRIAQEETYHKEEGQQLLASKLRAVEVAQHEYAEALVAARQKAQHGQN